MTKRSAIGRCLLAAIISLGSACVFGPHVGSFGPANSPSGVATTLRVRPNTVTAELLEVRDSGLVVLNGRTVTFVPYHAIDVGTFKQRGVVLMDGKSPSKDERNELRLVSRFPQGLTPETERRLLDAYRQSSIVVLDR
jgi:hypothetical protein